MVKVLVVLGPVRVYRLIIALVEAIGCTIIFKLVLIVAVRARELVCLVAACNSFGTTSSC